jgi:hypothetical protein
MHENKGSWGRAAVNRIRNESTKTGLNILPLKEKIGENTEKCKKHLH